MTPRTLVTLIALVAGLETTAAAQPGITPPSTVSKSSSGHDFSVTGSVILLDVQADEAHYNLFEITGEWRYRNRIGLAAIIGVGKVQIEDEGAGYEFGIFDLGAQAFYCLLGDFDHGLQIGLEGLFVVLRGADRYNGSVTASLGGLSVGPFLGYKLALRSGFTVIAQAGGAVFLSSTRASYDESDTEYQDQGAVLYPIANLNLGWSF